MKNQTILESLQNLVMRIETLVVYEPENLKDIYGVLRSTPQLQTPRIKLLLNSEPTRQNWVYLKYNILEDMVKKVGDFIK
ncbi:hypothetical protein [Pedobacter aquatilis]|uniref:hypothetical protein n=1 Tax=Pedobacter aquatilis TaxID=351343 RepID=UPI00292F67F1|nr:hypothetical protein [Pedobacter aquatilis]